MSNKLKKLCNKEGYELIYTKNKKVMLSFGRKRSKPTIRISRMFAVCSDEVAEAVASYIKHDGTSEKWLTIIEDYLTAEHGLTEFVIKAPRDSVVKQKSVQGNNKAFNNFSDDQYKEYKILKITQKDFRGNIKSTENSTSMRVNHGLLDVDMIVDNK